MSTQPRWREAVLEVAAGNTRSLEGEFSAEASRQLTVAGEQIARALDRQRERYQYSPGDRFRFPLCLEVVRGC